MRVIALLMLTLGAATAAPSELTQPAEAMPSLPDVAERAVQSVVNISVTQRVHLRGPRGTPLDFFFGPGRRGPPGQRFQRGQGSGVILTSDGLVLTNNHVVRGATDLTVTLADGREFKAETVGTDPKTDIAVLRIIDAEGLVPMPLGDSHALRLGETVIAIGAPFGLGHTVTRGIVSAKGRAGMNIVDYEDFIQTDAAINPGNSGGALLDRRGRLVGINTAILSGSGGSQGIGLAVPVHIAKKVADALVADGRVRRGWLGIGIQDLDGDLAKLLEVGVTKGVLVTQVEPESPAARAGLEARDVVVSLDGRPLHSSSQLRNNVSLAGPGQTVALEIIRRGTPRTVQVALGELPGTGRETRRTRQSPGDPSLDGLSLSALDRQARRAHRIPSKIDGALVRGVDRGSTAERAGLRPGDVIVQINNRRVRSVTDAVRRLKRGAALLMVNRRGRTLFISFNPS